jgi:predicted TIM-barrel fold metal-dependent hydrolase
MHADRADRDFEIIDSHSHWGPSVSMGTNVSTRELLNQMDEAGIARVMVIPFPSTAIMSNEINIRLLNETRKIPRFIPYFYIREDFPVIPGEYCGGKWHWMRGVQDSSSNYSVLDDPDLPRLIEALTKIGKPGIVEEELDFTERLIAMAPGFPVIIPHLGLLGGSPLDFLSAFKDNHDIYFDTALSSPDTILRFVETVGPERVIFGSDVPFGYMATELRKVTGLDIDDHVKELILGKNITRIAGLDLQ